jgi:putative oxygen-independent coproporphyrinogen III oxidase
LLGRVHPVPSELGVYVHVPFCSKRCDYCAFVTFADAGVDAMAAHSAATVTAIGRARERGVLPPASSVFFGGGTPSLLPAEQLTSILAAIPAADDVEVTVECNPDTVTEELLHAYAEAGVNRLSFGVQSMRPHVLAALGRTHDPDNVYRSIEAARRVGFSSFNVDLIYGVAGESLADWESTVADVISLQPPHVSAYALTIEPGTPLAKTPDLHPDEDVQADMYLLAESHFAAAGLSNYEVSNWAVDGHECRHNWLYWQQGDYLGFGCGAHSHRAGRRWWNVRTPQRYVELVNEGGDGESTGEQLTDDVRRTERLQLRLRTRLGVRLSELTAEAMQHVDDLVEGELIRVVDGPDGDPIVALTPSGAMMGNAITSMLI